MHRAGWRLSLATDFLRVVSANAVYGFARRVSRLTDAEVPIRQAICCPNLAEDPRKRRLQGRHLDERCEPAGGGGLPAAPVEKEDDISRQDGDVDPDRDGKGVR